MSNASPVKFTFDLDLRRADASYAKTRENKLIAEIDEARAEGRRTGLVEGERSAGARATEALAQAAQTLADHAATLNAALDDSREAMLVDAARLAGAVGKKLATHLLAVEPTAEIEALIAECLASLNAAPHLVIRCHPDLADRIREIATARIAASGFAGRLVVIGDPEYGLDDAKIEWADGGLTRDFAALEAEIDARIAQYVAQRTAARAETTQGAAV